MLPQAPRAWQTPTSWSIHSGMVLGSLHYGGFFDLTPPGVGGRDPFACKAIFRLYFALYDVIVFIRDRASTICREYDSTSRH